MNQQGYIIEIVDEKTAKLKMQRHSACASCGKCVTSSEKKDILVEVENAIGAKIGDHVEVNMDNVKVLKATAFVYLIPLMGLLIGTIGTYFILESLGAKSNIEMISAIVGFLTTFICYIVLNKNDKKFKDSKDFIPTITKILT
ncbi:SoxR reducing system RseC family protein [Faecalimicrobium sp. JNUCC 81]